MKPIWSPTQYLKFEDQRTRPANDLLARIPNDNPVRVTDIGCGPGNSTEILAHRFREAELRGFDNSPEMIETAAKRVPTARFDIASVERWVADQPQDVLFANAVLQWVPDHAKQLPRLVSQLPRGGVLAIQMLDNLNEPTHTSMRQTAKIPLWREKLRGADGERAAIESVNAYHGILKPHCSHVDIWRTTYYHPLVGLDGIVDWFKGTGLLPYLSRLHEEDKAEFIAIYRAMLADHYPVLGDGTVLLPFPRLFIVATK